MARVTENIKLENARIMFRNFSGAENRFNAKGKRNFSVVIDDPDLAHYLADQGWNIRILAPKNEGEEPIHIMSVEVSYKGHPPTVFMIANGKKTRLTEATIGTLDWADIKSCDMIINPYNWEVGGKSGVKGYLKTMYAVIELDDFASKYAAYDDDYPDGDYVDVNYVEVDDEEDIPF